jgi:hypothetical protein
MAKGTPKRTKEPDSEELISSDEEKLDSPYPFSEEGMRMGYSDEDEAGSDEVEDASGSDGDEGNEQHQDDDAEGADIEGSSDDGEFGDVDDDAAASDEDDDGAAAGDDDDGPGILGEASSDADDDEDADADADGGSSSSGGSDADNDGDADGDAAGAKPASFTEGGKAVSFAKAFAKVLSEAADASTILGGSKSLAKRKAEDVAEAAEKQAVKRKRLEIKRRGHQLVPKRGVDPAHDVREKQLLKTATRGVVLLFNAVNKAQKAKKEADAVGKKAHISKASFIAQLKGEQQPGTGALGLAATGQQAHHMQQAAAGDEGEQLQPGWKVLQDSFTGLAKSGKMKDWDRENSSGDEPESAQLEDQEGSGDDDGGDEGW